MKRLIRFLAVGVAAVLLASCGTPDNVVEKRRIRNVGQTVVYEVRTDRYGWEPLSRVEYKRCQPGRVYPDCKKP